MVFLSMVGWSLRKIGWGVCGGGKGRTGAHVGDSIKKFNLRSCVSERSSFFTFKELMLRALCIRRYRFTNVGSVSEGGTLLNERYLFLNGEILSVEGARRGP